MKMNPLRPLTRRRVIDVLIDIFVLVFLLWAGMPVWCIPVVLIYAFWNFWDGLTRMDLHDGR